MQITWPSSPSFVKRFPYKNTPLTTRPFSEMDVTENSVGIQNRVATSRRDVPLLTSHGSLTNVMFLDIAFWPFGATATALPITGTALFITRPVESTKNINITTSLTWRLYISHMARVEGMKLRVELSSLHRALTPVMRTHLYHSLWAPSHQISANLNKQIPKSNQLNNKTISLQGCN